MVSLTTVYVVSVLLTSIAGIGSSFAANKFVGGAKPAQETPPASVPLPSPPSDEEERPVLYSEPESDPTQPGGSRSSFQH